MAPTEAPVPPSTAPSAAPDGGKTPDPARRNPRSRRAILDASLELVGETGYRKLTIEAIAARAGVGKQTIYRWWPSKAAVLLDAFTSVTEEPGYQQGLPDTGDLAADLKLVLRATVDEFNDPHFEAPFRALAIAGAEDARLAADFLARLQEPGHRAYTERLRSAQLAGEIAAGVDVDLAVELVLSPFSQRWLTRSGPLTHAFSDALVDQVLAGLRPRD